MDFIPYQQRIAHIEGYSKMVTDRVNDGWQPYFINFLFNHIRGRTSTKINVMKDEVSRVFNTLLTNVVRRPASPSWTHHCPVFIGCPDLPVAKRDKELVRNLNVNGGLHFNGCLLLPPVATCRLNMSLIKHFQKHQERYYRDDRPLDRIHATYIESGTMIDYALKHIKRGNVSYDDILVLPRVVSELPDRAGDVFLRKRQKLDSV